MARADRISFLSSRPLIIVQGVLNASEKVRLVVDSGAERTLVSRRIAALLRLDLARPLRRQALSGVGRSPPVPVVRVDRLQVGARAVSGLEVLVYDLPALLRADGLLGLDFLRRFRVTFDFDSSVLILRDPARP